MSQKNIMKIIIVGQAKLIVTKGDGMAYLYNRNALNAAYKYILCMCNGTQLHIKNYILQYCLLIKSSIQDNLY